MRRTSWLRLGLALAVLLVGLVVATTLILAALGPALTRERIEAGLAGALERPVRIGAVRLQPWRLRLSLADVAVADADASALRRLSAGRVNVSLSISSVWHREIVIAIDIHALDVAADSDAAASTGASPFPLPETLSLGPVQARLGAIRATGARVDFRGGGIGLAATGVDATAHIAGGGLEVRLDADRLRVDAAGVSEETRRLSADGRLDADRVDVRRLAWRWHDQPVLVEGQVRQPWGPAPELALRATGDLALAPVARLANVGADVSGVARIVARAEGPLAALRIGGRVSAAPVSVAGQAVDTVTVDVRWEAGTLDLDPIQATAGAGRLSARATVDRLPGPATRLVVAVTEITLPPALGGLRDGRGDVDARVAGGAIEVTRGRLTWKAAEVALDGRAGADGALAGHVSLTGDLSALDVGAKLRPAAGRLDLRGQLSGRLAAPEITGRLDLAALVLAGRAVEPVAARFRLASARSASAGARKWDLALDVPRIASAPIVLEDVGAALALGTAGVDVAELRVRASGIPVSLAGTWGWDGTGRGRVLLGPVALDRVAGVPAGLGLSGSAQGQAEVAVAGGQPSVAGAVQLDRLSARGIGLGRGRVDVRLRGADLTAELALPARKARVEAHGKLAAGGTIDARLEVLDQGLKDLLAELSPGAAGLVEGRLSATGDVAIPLDRPDTAAGTLRVEPTGLTLIGEAWTSRGPVALRWERGALTLASLRLEGPAGAITGSGTLAGADPMQVALAWDNARLPGALAEVGRGTAHAELRGRGDDVELSRLDARWPGLSLVASGHARAAGLAAFRGEASADLARLSRAGGAAAAGTATAVVEARGPWNAIEATARLRAPALAVSGATVADVDVPLRLDRRTLRVEGARARVGSSQVTGDGTASVPDGTPLTLDGLSRAVRFTAQARAPALRLEDVAPLLPSAARGRGELALAARAEGTGQAWRGTATVTGSRAEVGGTLVRQIAAAVVFDRSRIELTELRAEASDLPVRASGAWDWSAGGRASATVGPGRLAGVGPPALGLAGTGRASLELTARPAAASVVEGSAQAELDGFAVSGVTLGRGRADLTIRGGALRGTLAFPERQLAANVEGAVAADGALRLARAEVIAREGTLTATGTIGPAGLDLRAQGRLPLDVLPSFSPAIRDAGGVLEIAARASGALAAPVLSGEGAVRGGRLLLRDRPETLRDIEARFALSPQGIQLREATATMGGGRLTARGDAALDGRAIGAYRVHVSARAVSLVTIEGMSSAWDADLELSGRGGQAWLQGGARLVRGVYTRDLSLLSMALSRPRPEAAVSEGRLHLLVRVRLDENLAVRTRTADLRAGGALTVQGTTGAPVVFGAIESRDGRIVFRGHDFTVTSASVRFADPRAVDPFLDVIATSRIREYEVTVQLSGRLSDLSVRMSSVPRLPPDDLVALVSLGATRAELKDSPATALLGETGRTLAQSLLGIDPTETGLRVSVISSDDPQNDPYRVWEDERDRPSATSRRTGDRREKVRLEYRLLDPVFLSAEYDPEGGYGADVIFRLRFR